MARNKRDREVRHGNSRWVPSAFTAAAQARSFVRPVFAAWKRLYVAQQHGPNADPDEWVVDASDTVDLTLKRERLCAMDRDGAFSWHPIHSGEVQPPPAAGSWWFKDHGTRDARRRELDGRVHDEHPWLPIIAKERIPEAA